MPLPALAALAPYLPIAGTLLSGIFSAREARKNREFQERMSSTAHVREVADLRSAGLNPILSSRLGGSSTPSGSSSSMPDLGPSVTSAMQLRLAMSKQKAEIDEIKSRTILNEQTAGNMGRDVLAGRYERISAEADTAIAQRDLAQMNVSQRREMFQLELQKVKQEIAASVVSAKRTEVLTMLDRLATTGAINEAEFEKRIGEMSPATRWLIGVARLYNLATGDPVRRIP